jgi:Ca2+-binding EF-hand superfamily protein
MTHLLKISMTATVLVIGAALPTVANETARSQIAANVLEADADADGALTLEEFTTLIDLNADSGIGRARMIQRNDRYSMAFGRIDLNGDGFLTKDELEDMAARARR